MLNDNKLVIPSTLYRKDGLILHIDKDPDYPADICAYLVKEGVVWMTTHRGERWDMMRAVNECPENARAFVGGLGLGLVLLYLAESGKTKDVLVAELDDRVIEVILPRITPWLKERYPDFKWKVLQGDAHKLIEVSGTFDWIFWDIWPSPELDTTKKEHEKYVMLSTPALNEGGVISTWHEIAASRVNVKKMVKKTRIKL